MSIPDQPFGFVAGRWVLSLADTPMDADRAPDYAPLHPGSVVFNNKLSHRVVNDGSGTVGIVKTRIEAALNEDGRIIDAEGNEFIALPVGVYSVTFSFGQYAWPNFDIEVKAEHTVDSPLWLPSKSPVPAGPGIVHVVSEEARLAAEAAAASAWAAVDTPGRRGPRGPEGPAGSVDNLPDAKNLIVYDASEWVAFNGSHEIIPNGVRFIVAENTSSARIEPTNIEVIPNHKYYVKATVTHPSGGVNRSRYITVGGNNGGALYTGNDNPVTISGVANSENSNPFRVYVDTRPNNIGDHVDVTDIVMIDLTEGFGVGNEPTAKQMDDWLEHTGWYTGPKPFVGDALHSQTLAGQGMGVRVDNTVGTRVLLDHPGGTTMLMGETPTISAIPYLENGWKQWNTFPLTLRRSGNRVYLEGLVDGTESTTGAFLRPPVGYRPSSSRVYPGIGINWNTYEPRKITANTTLISADAAPPGQYNFTISWETVDPWPTI